MGGRTLHDREDIPPEFKTIPSYSLPVGDPVMSVFVSGNDTTGWDDKEFFFVYYEVINREVKRRRI